jgi:hypothetical protein
MNKLKKGECVYLAPHPSPGTKGKIGPKPPKLREGAVPSIFESEYDALRKLTNVSRKIGIKGMKLPGKDEERRNQRRLTNKS